MYLKVDRSLARDLREVIEDEIQRAGDTYVASVVAHRIVDRLRESDPELLNKYLDQHAVQIIRHALVSIEASHRTQARAQANTRNTPFTDAVTRFQGGDQNALGSWLDTTYVVTTANQRKRLGSMDKDDLEFAASDYRERAKTNSMQALFLTVLAERVGARTVGEVFDNEELARMWRSLD